MANLLRPEGIIPSKQTHLPPANTGIENSLFQMRKSISAFRMSLVFEKTHYSLKLQDIHVHFLNQSEYFENSELLKESRAPYLSCGKLITIGLISKQSLSWGHLQLSSPAMTALEDSPSFCYRVSPYQPCAAAIPTGPQYQPLGTQMIRQ